MGRAVEVSRQELIARRKEILRCLGVSFEELERRVQTGSMTDTEWSAWEELRGIAFLLGDG